MKFKHTIKARRRQLRRYNLSADDYNLLYEKQKGVCAVCGKPEIAKNVAEIARLLSIDHNHKTGKIRGLLCMSCNVFLGHLEKNSGLISQALAYLKNC